MKISKKLEAEILQVMEDYWGSYLEGNMDKWTSFLRDEYRNIGTTREEIWNSKAEIVEYTEKVFSAAVGLAELRDKKSQIFLYDPYIMVHEYGDLYIKTDEGWVFYAPTRLSSLLKKTREGWKIFHQHGSYPDSKSEEGEAFGFDEMKIENKKLRDAILSRTKELEQKNRALEIETALERVRTQSMLMQHTDELGKTVQVFHHQLISLGVDSEFSYLWLPDDARENHLFWATWNEIRNEEVIYYNRAVQYKLDMEEPDIVACFEAWESNVPVHITNVPTQGIKTYFETWKELLAGIEKFSPQNFSKGLFYVDAYMKYGCFGMVIKRAISEEEQNILYRFALEFERTYTRFLDLQKAELHAREANIEAALERVQTIAMGMIEPDDLSQICQIIFEELKKLKIGNLRNSEIVLIDRDKESIRSHYYSDYGITGIAELDYTSSPVLIKWVNDLETADDGFAEVIIEEEEIQQWREYRESIGYLPDPKLDNADRVFYYSYSIGTGALSISCFDQIEKANIKVLERFRNVFKFAYKRYIDISLATAQAREAMIETALERVRSRTMGMHKSEELQEVIKVVYNQFEYLKINVEHAGFILDYKSRDDMYIWLADNTAVPAQITIPYFDSPHWNSFLEAREKGESFFANKLSYEEKNKFYKDLFEFIPNVDQKIKEYYMNVPALAISTVLVENIGLYIENFSGTAYSDEENKILMRVGKVFQQAYTRFLDLEKAEAQAREAQIELALEKIRVQVTSMQESTDLFDIVVSMRKEFISLGHEADYFWHMRWSPDNYEMSMTSTDGDRLGMVITVPKFVHDQIPSLHKWEKSVNPYFVLDLDAKGAWDYIEKMNTYGRYEQMDPHAPSEEDIHHLGGLTFIIARTTHGEIGFSLAGKVPEPPQESIDTLVRFAGVFDLAYRRFEDLKEAELQKREAEIQLALERVRARTMAMQNSEELPEAANLLFHQVQSLGMPAWSAGYCIWKEDKKAIEAWMSSEGVMQPPFIASTTEDKLFIAMRENQEKGKDFHVIDMGGEELVAHYKYMRTLPVVGDILDSIIAAGHPLPEYQIMHYAYFSHGLLLFITYEPVSEAYEIFKRFANVFEQTYTRFLDLKKAEAQARESRIEAALERVRSRSMAMHHTSELQSVIHNVHEELLNLNISVNGGSFIVINDDVEDELHCWGAGGTAKTSELIHVPHFGKPFCTNLIKNIKKGPGFFTEEFTQAEKQDYFTELFNHHPWSALSGKRKKETLTSPGGYTRSCCVLKHTSIFIINHTGRKFSESENDILKRFAKVFEQSYTRFLDIQKAEAQAREAKIEAALEKVRARAMGMHKSDELSDLVSLVFKELVALDMKLTRCLIWIFNEDQSAQWWMANSEDYSKSAKFHIPNHDHPTFQAFLKAWSENEKMWEYNLEGRTKESFDQFLFHETDLKKLPKYVQDAMMEPDQVILTATFNNFGALQAAGLEPLSLENKEIVKRFGQVFDQTYTRFLDIQKAEAQAKEAQIEAALEKVRSRTMAMHNPDELEEVVAIIAEKLQDLDVILDANGAILCTYFKDSRDVMHWIAAPDFSGSGRYLLPYFEHPIFRAAWESKTNGDDYFSKSFSVEEKNSFYEYAFEHSDYKSFPDDFKQWVFQNDKHSLSFAWAKNSAILIPSHTGIVPSESDQEILKRFATVFEQAYVRFRDLKVKEEQAAKIEVEKRRLEKTLEHLQATQVQLIQSEKMASLGELTAGIAHEIQNPLNFVNNFSELSSELIDEMLEEIKKGDLEEVIAISKDIRHNLEKINHHGKRADSIVKGMLLHSRSSKGEKVLTDINALCDEFLRLSYHGLRAKDRSFNAEFEMNLDPDLPKVEVVPQDIGRVLLNLINNAFQACNERSEDTSADRSVSAAKIQEIPTFQNKSSLPGQNPLTGLEEKTDGKKSLGSPEEKTLRGAALSGVVKVATKNLGDKIEITVTDNGPGIPDEIKDKIFQPFFTTKPTGQGTGLGLSLAYDIVKAHGGEIRVESEEGEGTEFIIQLPFV